MATINFNYPVAGAAPSTKAVSTCTYVNGQVVFVDADTSAVVTTNFGSSGINPNTGISPNAALFPAVVWNYYSAPTTTLPNPITVTVGTNAVTFAKLAQTGSACTISFNITRPNHRTE
jgi:hypothetical protein